MMKEAEKNKEADNKKKEVADAKNDAEQVVFMTEKALKDLGEKVTDSDKKEAEDLMEETMVTLISRHMYGKKSLIKGFNGTDFDDDFNFILNDVYHNYKEIVNSNKENSLDFQGFITRLMSDKKNMEVMDKNMKLSNFIKQMISVHKIDEINC